MKPLHQFASDNQAGICPEAWSALAEANVGHTPSYGDDPWTRRATDLLRGLFETDCDVYFAFNGTAANALSLATLGQSYHAIVCHEASHIEMAECGAPEFFSNGMKLLACPGESGKLDPITVARRATRDKDIHFPKPRVFSITQATEVGTVYRPDELRALCDAAKKLGLRVHMDGARFANAVASIGCNPADLSWKAGVDVLCFGGTKNGMVVGEAVIFFDRELSVEFDYRCKQAGQLASKMRFVSAQWVGMLESGAWMKHATHANAMARRLAAGLRDIPGTKVLFPVEANAVFAEFPARIETGLKDRGWRFFSSRAVQSARLMCAWDTTEQDVDQFIADAKAL